MTSCCETATSRRFDAILVYTIAKDISPHVSVEVQLEALSNPNLHELPFLLPFILELFKLLASANKGGTRNLFKAAINYSKKC